MQTCSIIIPIYNEEKNIREKFGTLVDWIKQQETSTSNKDLKFELVCAEDGSTDGSYELLLDLKSRSTINMRVFHSNKRLGKGGGFIKAFMKVKSDIVILYDADFAVPPRLILKLIDEIDKGYDIVIGSRSNRETRFVKNPSAIRFIYGKVSGIIVRVLFHIPLIDTQCGFKAFNRKTVLPILNDVRLTGWIFDVEIILRAMHNHLKIKEVPVIYQHQKDSKIRLIQDPIKILIDFARLRVCILRGYQVGLPYQMKKLFRMIFFLPEGET
ncbi:MAG: glycosyltransferase [Promethearchaeota archaeon]